MYIDKHLRVSETLIGAILMKCPRNNAAILSDDIFSDPRLALARFTFSFHMYFNAQSFLSL